MQSSHSTITERQRQREIGHTKEDGHGAGAGKQDTVGPGKVR